MLEKQLKEEKVAKMLQQKEAHRLVHADLFLIFLQILEFISGEALDSEKTRHSYFQRH